MVFGLNHENIHTCNVFRFNCCILCVNSFFLFSFSVRFCLLPLRRCQVYDQHVCFSRHGISFTYHQKVMLHLCGRCRWNWRQKSGHFDIRTAYILNQILMISRYEWTRYGLCVISTRLKFWPICCDLCDMSFFVNLKTRSLCSFWLFFLVLAIKWWLIVLWKKKFQLELIWLKMFIY